MGDPFISAKGDYLIFRGYDNSLGAGDLYISYQVDTGWTAPVNLGEPINSKHHEMCPYVTTDGRFFIWSSSRLGSPDTKGPNTPVSTLQAQHRSPNNGQLNMYYMSADFVEKLRPQAKGEDI